MIFPWRPKPEEKARGAFFYLRVDDRLIHGQVVIGWGTLLDLNRLVLANDRVAADPHEREFYRQIIPENMNGEVEDLKQAKQNSHKPEYTDCRCLVVVASVEDALLWMEGGKKPDLLILGGIHARDDRRHLRDYLYLSDSEITMLMDIEKNGVRIICRDLPTSAYLTFQEVL